MVVGQMLKRLFAVLCVLGIAGHALLAGGGIAYAQSAENDAPKTPRPENATPIKHFIFLMQENHSYDNYFGTYPGGDGIPADVCMPVDPFNPAIKDCVRPFRIGDNEVELADPDHSDATHELQYNDGGMDGFVYALNQRNQDGRLAMGYYDDSVLSYYWNVADEYVLFDKFFSSAAGGSFINHFYWVAADSGEPKEGEDLQALLAKTPTIFDRLEEAGVSWKFYVQNYEPDLNYRTVQNYPGNRASQVIWVPLLNMDRFLDNPELNSKIVDLNEYYQDLVDGTLPEVAFIVPSGPSEHPPSNIDSGQRFVKTLIQMLMQSKYWSSSAFMWAYDDWGGWYDHVPPPKVDEHGYGFRVPALLVSPFAKKGFVDSTELDYTSALRFIEDNWHLEPLAARDAAASSIANAFDFGQSPRKATFLSYTRMASSPPAGPNTNAIYVAYGTGLVLAAGFILMTVLRRDNHRRTGHAPGAQPQEPLPEAGVGSGK